MQYRIVHDPPRLGISYANVNDPSEVGSTPLHEELDRYLEEKGVEFDMGIVYITTLVSTDVEEHEFVRTTKYADARIWLFGVPQKFLLRVIIPGLEEVANHYTCRVAGLTTNDLAGKACWVLEVKH